MPIIAPKDSLCRFVEDCGLLLAEAGVADVVGVCDEKMVDEVDELMADVCDETVEDDVVELGGFNFKADTIFAKEIAATTSAQAVELLIVYIAVK
jgi:hypothetical protein